MKLKSLATSAVALSVVAFAVSGCGGSEADAEGGEVLSMAGGAPSFNYTVPQLVDSLDLGSNHGVELEYSQIQSSGPLLVASLMSGEVDMAQIGLSTVLDARAQGQDLKVIACTNAIVGYVNLRKDVLDSLNLPKDADIETKTQALKGLNIVTTPPGSTYHAALVALATDAGLDPERDLTISAATDPTAVVAGVKQGKFDGSFWGTASLEGNVVTGEAEVLIDIPRGDLRPAFGEALDVAGVFAASAEFIESHADEVAAATVALGEAAELARGGDSEARDALRADWFPDMDQELFDSLWSSADGIYPEEAKCSQSAIEAQIEFADVVSENDLSKITYEELVLPSSRP